jgi:hypothetical protein
MDSGSKKGEFFSRVAIPSRFIGKVEPFVYIFLVEPIFWSKGGIPENGFTISRQGQFWRADRLTC